MKNILITAVLLTGIMVPAQWNSAADENVFQETEEQYQSYGSVSGPGGGGLLDGPDDPEPVPVNGGLPFLALAGAVLALYALRRKQVAG